MRENGLGKRRNEENWLVVVGVSADAASVVSGRCKTRGSWYPAYFLKSAVRNRALLVQRFAKNANTPQLIQPPTTSPTRSTAARELGALQDLDQHWSTAA